MFKDFFKSLGSTSKVEPRQGKRIDHEELENGEVIYTIRGRRFPGFLVFFGLMFGAVPTFVLLGVLFGAVRGTLEFGEWGVWGLLFVLPFFAVGAATFFTGLFLWLGKTQVMLRAELVRVERSLFRWVFQKREFSLTELNLKFELSHTSDNHPHYKMSFKGDSKSIGVGGSLPEEELLWLERSFRVSLGQNPGAVVEVRKALMAEEEQNLDEVEFDEDYQSKALQITKTIRGWEIRHAYSKLGAIGSALFGSIFLFAGMLMMSTSREFLFDLLPALRKLAESGESSGGEPPVWFALIFAGAGSCVILSSLFLLGRKAIIELGASRLVYEARWFMMRFRKMYPYSEIKDIEVKRDGEVNDRARYTLRLILNGKKKKKLLFFATPEDVGQVGALLRRELKLASENDPESV